MRNSMSYSLTHIHTHTHAAWQNQATSLACCARFIIENRKPSRQPAAKISHICAFFRRGPAAKITSAPHLIDGHKQDQEPKEKKCSRYPARDCVTPPEFFMHLIIVAGNIVPRRAAKYLHKCAQAHGARFQHPAAPNAHASNQTQHQFGTR
jgi:hypothetical protein